MSELYHAKRSHKYVAKVKGAGSGGRPLYFYSEAAYRSYLNGLKEKTGKAIQEKTRKYEALAEQHAASYRLNRDLNRQARSEMERSSNLNRFHSNRANAANDALETHTRGMKAVTKMANSRSNGNTSMNGREAGEFARQHVKATEAARTKNVHSEAKNAAATKYKASNAWKEATQERAGNEYNKTILAQRRAHQARQEYEKTLPGKLEKTSREMSALPNQWKRNAAIGVEATKRTIAGNKLDKYNAWKLNKTADKTSNKKLADAYRSKAAKLKTRYDGSITGIKDNAVSAVRQFFKKGKNSSVRVSSLSKPDKKTMQRYNRLLMSGG